VFSKLLHENLNKHNMSRCVVSRSKVAPRLERVERQLLHCLVTALSQIKGGGEDKEGFSWGLSNIFFSFFFSKFFLPFVSLSDSSRMRAWNANVMWFSSSIQLVFLLLHPLFKELIKRNIETFVSFIYKIVFTFIILVTLAFPFHIEVFWREVKCLPKKRSQICRLTTNLTPVFHTNEFRALYYV